MLSSFLNGKLIDNNWLDGCSLRFAVTNYCSNKIYNIAYKLNFEFFVNAFAFFFSNTRRCHLLFQSHVSRGWDFQKVDDRDSIFFMLCIFVAWAWFIVQREKERDIISVDPDDAVSRFFFLFFFLTKHLARILFIQVPVGTIHRRTLDEKLS